MSIVYAGITPHPPILIPSIGKENIELIKDTQSAMQQMEKNLYVKMPEVIVIISPHGVLLPDSFTTSLCTTELCTETSAQFEGNFEDFGDFSTSLKFKNDPKLANMIYTEIRKESPITMVDIPKLDHGSLIPLYYLTAHLPDIAIMPISFSLLDFEDHIKFGRNLKKILTAYDKRVAVIASGDLSHRLTKDAPAGFSERGTEFDRELIENLENNDFEKILKMDKNFIEDAGECGLRSILILLGIVGEMNAKFHKLSYEGPLGVGYLVGEYNFA